MKLFGSSGIRAVYGEKLLETAFRVGLAAGQRFPGVIVGRDTRLSGPAMARAVFAGLKEAGADYRDAGVAPTPAIAYLTREFDAGIMITASHNPPEYNGLKLLNPDGSSFDTRQQEKMSAAVLDCNERYDKKRPLKEPLKYRGALGRHIEAILADFPKKVKLKVVVDAGGGAAALITPRLLEKMGCEVVRMYCRPDGSFPRGSEPREDNLQKLCRKVISTGAALGLAHDGDADRLMAVDEKGRFIPGDKLLAVFLQTAGLKDIVTTLDASMAVEELGAKVRRTKIGDTWVSEELRKGGEFGGETSGAWIFPRISLCPDGIYAAATLTAVAARKKLSALVDAVPSYPLFRGSLDSRGLNEAELNTSLFTLKPDKVSRKDGIKLSFKDGWLLVRPSGTEPKIRLTAEARTERRARELYERGLEAVWNSLDSGRA